MGLNRLLRPVAWVVAVISAALFAGEFTAFTNISDYNEAIVAGDFEQAGLDDSAYGVFAKAYAAETRGDIDSARTLYGSIGNDVPATVRSRVHFNLGNSYMRQALQFDQEQERDLALPLLELAKVSYGESLRLDEHLWGARFNLALILERLPDTEVKEPEKLEFDTGAVRTIISADTEENLP